MSEIPNIELIPKLPKEISDAANNGNLVLFVGAGVSRLVGYPDWNGFADMVLEYLLKKKYIDHNIKNSIIHLDARKKLSIAEIFCKDIIPYKDILTKNIKENLNNKIHNKIADIRKNFINKSLQEKSIVNDKKNIYDYLNEFNCNFVTTNYDYCLNKNKQRFYINDPLIKKDELIGKLSEGIIYLHGYLDSEMIITSKQYLEHYKYDETNKVNYFLEQLFKNNTILFIGYGLEEIDILQMIIKTSKVGETHNLFVLQGFYSSQNILKESMCNYYKNIHINCLPFELDKNDYHQLTEIIQDWKNEIAKGKVETFLIDKANELEGIINEFE